jgi:hypothetical protein
MNGYHVNVPSTLMKVPLFPGPDLVFIMAAKPGIRTSAMTTGSFVTPLDAVMATTGQRLCKKVAFI